MCVFVVVVVVTAVAVVVVVEIKKERKETWERTVSEQVRIYFSTI